MADIGKKLVCYEFRGKEQSELVHKEDRLIELLESPSLEVNACLDCAEMTQEQIDTLVQTIKDEKAAANFEEEKAAAQVVFNEMREKYGFE